VDRPRPNAAVVKLLLDTYPPAASLRDTTDNLPLNIALDHGAVKSVAVVKQLLDAHPESISEPNANGRMPIHSVLYSPHPDAGVARFLAKQYPPAITMESKSG
jgi:ankyrin repeat protein